MPDLERALREARPDWPRPSSGAEARARAALGLGPPARSPRAWLRPRGRSGARLLATAAVLATAGAAVAAALIGSGSSSGAPAGRPASLGFDAPRTVGRPASLLDGAPAVAVGGDGTVTVVWGRAGRIVASSRPRGGRWSPPERISDPARRAGHPRVGADGAGRVTVVWRERIAGRRVTERFRLPSGAPAGELTEVVDRRWAVVARSGRPGGGWGPLERLSAPTARVRDVEQPGLAVARDGRALVLWDDGGDVLARARDARGRWAGEVRVGGGGGEAVDPGLAMSPGGAAVAVWSNRVGGGAARRYEVRAAVRDRTGRWSAPAVVNEPWINPPHAAGAVDDAGDAVVAWGARGTLAAMRPAGGDWTAPAELAQASPVAIASAPLVGVERGGGAMVVGGNGVGAHRSRDGARWDRVALAPATGRRVGAAMVADASGGLVLARALSGPGRMLVERLGAATATALPAAGRPVMAAGPEGTLVVAWAGSGPAYPVVAAVAEGGR